MPTAFDLAPDWSVKQVFPYDAAYYTLAPGEDYVLDLQAGLPSHLTSATDILKVFATIGSTDFQWLQLPVLDGLTQTRGNTKHYRPTAPLEELLFALMEDALDTRNLKPGVRPSREWVTVQLEVDIQQ